MWINNPECNGGKQEHRNTREKLRDKDRENWTANWRESVEEETFEEVNSEQQIHRSRAPKGGNSAYQMGKPDWKLWCPGRNNQTDQRNRRRPAPDHEGTDTGHLAAGTAPGTGETQPATSREAEATVQPRNSDSRAINTPHEKSNVWTCESQNTELLKRLNLWKSKR